MGLAPAPLTEGRSCLMELLDELPCKTKLNELTIPPVNNDFNFINVRLFLLTLVRYSNSFFGGHFWFTIIKQCHQTIYTMVGGS